MYVVKTFQNDVPKMMDKEVNRWLDSYPGWNIRKIVTVDKNKIMFVIFKPEKEGV